MALADIGDTRIDAATVEGDLELDPEAEAEADIEIEAESGTAKNVIIMVGDGMGWEIARAAAIQEAINEGAEGDTLADFYTEGTGTGLSFQNLSGYGIATTGGTYIDGSKSNSALTGDTLDRETGVSLVREGFELENLPGADLEGEFDPAQVIGFFPELREGSVAPILGEFDPNFDERPLFAENEDGEVVQVGGFLNAYDTENGRALPWLEDPDPDYPKNLFPDSANTASTLYSGVKSYNAAIGVDIYEEDVLTIGEAAREAGKSFGVVSSVPFSHATPGAAVGHVSHRNKLTETERVENFEVVLDESGVPVHEEHGEHEEGESEPVFELDADGNPIPIEDDNILYQILNESQPEVILGGGHPDGRGDERYLDLETLEDLRNGETVYTFTERGENASEVLANTAADIDVNAGEKLFGVYGARGQGGNLPWTTANGDYSNLGLPSRLDAERPLEDGETVEEFIASEIDANPTLAELTAASLDILEDDQDGFWVSIEGGDIDWAAHDNNLDNMLGATLEFADSVEVVQDWIAENGGYEENLLIVTADHDHYFTLNDNFPELLREVGAEGLTTSLDEDGNVIATNVDQDGVPLIDEDGNPFTEKVDNLDPEASGHFWGSDPDVKVGWSHHTTIPVPVYYEGAGSEYLDNAVGQGFEQYGFDVPGIDGLIDQTHIAEAQFNAFGLTPGDRSGDSAEGNPDVISLLDAEDLSIEVLGEVSSDYANVGGFYQAIDAEGTVINPENGEEVAVGDEGYEAAALANSVAEIGDAETATLELAGDFVYVPYLLANGEQFFSSFAEVNPEGLDHVQQEVENTFRFEDIVGGGDLDFNDFVLTVETV
ncbi:MAG: alkaline phosphatase [Cyanobacteria bacterium J06643_13]